MSDPVFFPVPAPIPFERIVAVTGATVHGVPPENWAATGVQPLDRAGPADLTFFDNPKYRGALAGTRAGACFTTTRHLAAMPEGLCALVVGDPHAAVAEVAALLFPTALRPASVFGAEGVSPGAIVHPKARIEAGATVDPGAVIGAGAEIGAGTVVCATAAIGPGVRVGRDCSIGPGASLLHALVGNRVIIHGGVRIGQDGFGYVMSSSGHRKVPQLGRVIVQDDVEIGAGTTIDRGAGRDTVIGEGTKIDNLVQIGHNVTIGRHCVLVAQVGVSGSATLGDFVVLGGRAGVNGHVTIGDGAQIAATSSVKDDVPAGARWGGSPAKPVRIWFREVAAVAALAAKGPRPPDSERGGE